MLAIMLGHPLGAESLAATGTEAGAGAFASPAALLQGVVDYAGQDEKHFSKSMHAW